MRYAIGGTFAFFLALVQASSIEQFHILGVAPNLMLVMLTSWLVVRGLDDVLPMVACAGVTIGFIGMQTPGLVLLALLVPLLALGALRELRVLNSEALLVAASIVAATLCYESMLLAGILATGGVFDLRTAFAEVVVPAALVNLMITPPVYLLMRLARPAPSHRWAAY